MRRFSLRLLTLVTIMFLLINCQKEEDFTEELLVSETSEQQFKQKITFNELQNKLTRYASEEYNYVPLLFEKNISALANGSIQSTANNAEFLSELDESFVFGLDTDNIVMFTDDHVTTYTLRAITSQDDGTSFTNVIFIEHEGILDEGLIRYIPNIDYIPENIFEGTIELLNNSGGVITQYNTNGVIQSNNTSVANTNTTSLIDIAVTTSVEVSCTFTASPAYARCSVGGDANGHEPQEQSNGSFCSGSQQVGWSYDITCYDVWAGGGGGGSTGSGGNNNNDNGGGSGGIGDGLGGGGGLGGGDGGGGIDLPTDPVGNNELSDLQALHQLIILSPTQYSDLFRDPELTEQLLGQLIADGDTPEARTEIRMRIDVEKAQGEWNENNTGVYRNRAGLSYTATYNPSAGGTMYRLDNDLVLYVATSKRVINKWQAGTIASSEPATDGYTYIYSYDTNRWYEYRLPPANNPKTDLTFLFDAFWTGVKFVGRYGLPLEDAIILIDGNDFDGVEQNRATTAGLIIVGFVPGGKFVKPITRVVRGTQAWKVIAKTGSKTVSLSFKVVNGVVTFGNRSKLREIIATTALEEAHHIIPWAKRNHKVVQEAAYEGFHMNSKANGKALQKFSSLTGEGLHGNHPAYDKFIQKRLDDFQIEKGVNLNPENSSQFINESLLPELDILINEAKNSGMNLNTYFRDVINPANGIN